MKFSLFSVAALASSAFAAPLLNTVVPTVKGVVPTVEGVVGKVTRGVAVPDVTNAAGLVNTLTVVVSDVKTQTSAIKVIVSKVNTNEIKKVVAITEVSKHLSAVNDILTAAVGSLTGVVGLHIDQTDVNNVLNLVIVLVKEIVTIVEEVVSVLGLGPVITVVVSTVLSTVSSLLLLVTGLVGGIIPGLINTLSPVLESFDGSILGGILTPVATVLTGLTI